MEAEFFALGVPPENVDASSVIDRPNTASTSNWDPSLVVSSSRKRSPPPDENRWDVVYSDGACKGNGKVGSIAGIGVWWGPDDPRSGNFHAIFWFVVLTLIKKFSRTLSRRSD